MFRTTAMIAFFAACGWRGLPSRAAEPEPATKGKTATSAARDFGAAALGKWIDDLDSASFSRRRAAVRKLHDAGLSAIAPLMAAADGDRPEVTRRAIELLDNFASQSEPDLAAAARDALERLSHSTHVLAAHHAVRALRARHLAEQRQSIERIEQLGGSVEIGDFDGGELVIAAVWLGREWTGAETDLEHVRALRRVQRVVLYGREFTDAALDYIRPLSGLQELRLYATEVTDEGERSIRAAFPALSVDRRRGAMLGVRGNADAKGCRISHVQRGSAADEAGLEVGDVIVRIDAVDTHDMPALIAEIGKHRAGERIHLRWLHDDESREADVVLGELDPDEMRR